MWRPLLLFYCLSLQLWADLSALYLTWFSDPATTMTIQWHTPPSESGDAVFFKSKEDAWLSAEGTHHTLSDRLVHAVSLAHLTPDTEYQFRIGQDPAIYRFRTAPRSEEHTS